MLLTARMTIKLRINFRDILAIKGEKRITSFKKYAFEICLTSLGSALFSKKI